MRSGASGLYLAAGLLARGATLGAAPWAAGPRLAGGAPPLASFAKGGVLCGFGTAVGVGTRRAPSWRPVLAGWRVIVPRTIYPPRSRDAACCVSANSQQFPLCLMIRFDRLQWNAPRLQFAHAGELNSWRARSAWRQRGRRWHKCR